MKTLTIVQMNDSHAYLDLHPELYWERGQAVYRKAGGYARIAAILQKIREENPGRVLFVDGGDTFHGTYPAVETRGEALVPILNALQPAAMTAHWEFAYTPRGFKGLTERLDYPMLAMNVYEKETGALFFRPYTVVEAGGLRIGIAGIASNIVDKTMPPSFSEGVQFTGGREELPGIIEQLRGKEKVDLVILNSHLGFPQDMDLLESVRGVDVDLSAHTHHRLQHLVRQGDTLVTQSGSHGAFLTRLDLTVENGRIVDARHAWIDVLEQTMPDAHVAELVRNAEKPFEEMLSEVVGETRLPLDRGLNMESTMDNFLLEGLLHVTGAQMVFSNGWRYGASVLPGPIRLGDLYNMAPMNPPVSTVELTGAALQEMLEENIEHTYARDPQNQIGGYLKRALGIRVLFKIENPKGHRVQKVFVGDEEARPDAVYQAAFITEQGVPPRYGQNRKQREETLVEALRQYLKDHGPVAPRLRGTFMAV